MRPAWRFQVVLFGNFVILNLFLAILMSSFDEQRGKLHDALALGPYWALLLQPLQLLQLCSQVDQRGRLPMHQQAMESKRELTRVWHPENLTNTSHHRFQSFPVQVHQRVQVQVWVLHGSTNQTFPLRLLAVSTCLFLTLRPDEATYTEQRWAWESGVAWCECGCPYSLKRKTFWNEANRHIVVLLQYMMQNKDEESPIEPFSVKFLKFWVS